MKYLLLPLLQILCFSASAGIITVTNGNDAGPGSLRQAIHDARDGDVIRFSHVTSVLLSSGELVISKNVTVEGGGITIKGRFAPLIKAEKAKQIILKQLNLWEDNKKPIGALLNLSNGLRLEGCRILTPMSKKNGVVTETQNISNGDQPGLLYPGSTGLLDLPMVQDPGTGGGSEGSACTTNVYRDRDGDGLGDPISPSVSCVPLAGFVSNADDCDDNHPNGSIVYVNTAVIGGNNDGSSWANAYNDLQDALAFASTCTNITQIWVAKGTYYPDEGISKTDNDRSASFEMRNNLAIYGGFAGTETSLSQRNWRTNTTILSGDIDKNDGAAFANNAGNSFHVINNSESLDNTSILDGFTISGGNANADEPHEQDGTNPGRSGGGLYLFDSAPSVANCTFSGNSADFGGGMYSKFNQPLITNCVFSANLGLVAGGGIFTFESGPTVINSSFSGNTTNGYGGGVFLQSYTNQSPKVLNCSFSGNTAISSGGAILIEGAGTADLDVTVSVTNCILWGNSSAIDVADLKGAPTVTYSIVQGGSSGTGNLNVDPLFVNAANGDLHLQSNSPAVDAGSDAANDQTTDLDGNNRKFDAIPGGSLIDMGAFENQQAFPQSTSTTLTVGNPACPDTKLFFFFQVKSGDDDVRTGFVRFTDNGHDIGTVDVRFGFIKNVVINTPGDHTIEADYEGAPGFAPSNSTTAIQTILPPPNVDFSGLPQSICSNAASIVLTGSPTGGTFSGPGVNGASFDPSVAGPGIQPI